MSSVFSPSRPLKFSLFFAAVAVSVSPLHAQVVLPNVSSVQPTELAVVSMPEAPASVSSSSLPEAPQPVSALEPQTSAGNPRVNGPIAPKYAKYIPAGETAQPITAHDKVILGLKDLVSPENALAIVLTPGYEHVANGEPNYGTNSTAFAKRVGAAAIRETSQGLFTDAVFAPMFREDPRYYVRGPGHSFLNRTAYAITRPLVTKTDSGNSSVNGALIVGYAASSALTYAYYPQINRNAKDTASTFGGAIGGAALGFFVSEFENDALQALHLKKKP